MKVSVILSLLCELCCRHERDVAHALKSLTQEGLSYLRSVDDSTLTDFVHTFFCGGDPGYDSPGKLKTSSIDPTLLNYHH